MSEFSNLFYRIYNSEAIDIDDCNDGLQDAAFDLTTIESSIIGVAEQLLSGTMPSNEQLSVLNGKILDGTKLFLLNGEICDLQPKVKLLNHAKQLVSLQAMCHEYLKTRGGGNRNGDAASY